MKPSNSVFHSINGLCCHTRAWGDPGNPQLFLLHGWMDVSASFQFLVDALRQNWQFIAADWRGFGLSEWNQGVYWLQDYLADLDALLNFYSADTPANLVGHSLGGSVACIYGGVKPERVKRIISLEGFGVPRSAPTEAPLHYARWLAELSSPPQFKPYASFAEVAARLKKSNPRLTDNQAAFLARHWAKQSDSGKVELLRKNGEDALGLGVFGVPTTVVDGELFWGFDATPMLKSYLANPEMFKRGELARVSNLPGGV